MVSEYDWLKENDVENTDGDFAWLAEDYEVTSARQLARPVTYARRNARRTFISGLKKEALNVLIPELPPPDVDLYVIGNGAGAEIRHGINPLAFDFGSFIPHIVRMLGDYGCIAYVSTWTMARQHSLTLLQMVDDERLCRLTVLTDPYFQRREAAIAAELITGLQARKQRYLAFKNHVKCIAIATGDEQQTCVVTGSANLSAQPRCEQYVLTTAPDVYRFYRDEFFERMLTVV